MADIIPSQSKQLHGERETPKNDFRALINHVQTHPMAYIGAAGFVVLVLIITGVYRLAQKSALESAATQLARALDVETPVERAAALGKIVDSGSPLAARALYLQGESELEAANYDAASVAFTRLRESYPDYEFVPEAVEGLGLIQEDAGRFSAARSIYEEVASKWPDSTAAQRQPFNIARCFEGENNLPSAIEQYRSQLEVFPGSTIAVRAQQRLDELRTDHPELFPTDAPQLDTLQPATDAAAAPAPEAATPSTTEEAPATEAPVAEPAPTAPETPAPAATPPTQP